MHTTRTNVYIKTSGIGSLPDDLKIHTLCDRYPYARFFIIADSIYAERLKWLHNVVLFCPQEDGTYHIRKDMAPLRIGIFLRPVKDEFMNYMRGLDRLDQITSALESECDLILDPAGWDLASVYGALMPAIPAKTPTAVFVPCGHPDPAGGPAPDQGYLNTNAGLIRNLSDRGYKISMLAFSASDNSQYIMQRIMDLLPGEYRDKVFCSVYERDIDMLLRAFAEAELAVVSRPCAHIIAALCGCRTLAFLSEKESEQADLLLASGLTVSDQGDHDPGALAEQLLSSPPYDPESVSAYASEIAAAFYSPFDPLLKVEAPGHDE